MTVYLVAKEMKRGWIAEKEIFCMRIDVRLATRMDKRMEKSWRMERASMLEKPPDQCMRGPKNMRQTR